MTERFGPYELVSLLGRGGMGEVYRAYDTTRKRTVALKRLPRHLAGDPDYEVRFRREAEVAARLTEPHIIPIHDYGEIAGQLYIDMRLITGTDLSGVLADAGPLPPARAVAIVGQVATALAAAHGEGLVHRDVKPSNVLISTTDRGEDFVHLVDFGIVHEKNSTVLTATGSTIGTIDYMAPERLQQERCDHRVDVYSLGCVLYEALTGAKPFPGGSAAATMFAHMNAPPPRPSQSRPGIPPGLDEVVATAMAKDPDARYPSTTALATGAYRALTGAPRSAGPAVTRVAPGPAGASGGYTATNVAGAPGGGPANAGFGMPRDAGGAGQPGAGAGAAAFGTPGGAGRPGAGYTATRSGGGGPVPAGPGRTRVSPGPSTGTAAAAAVPAPKAFRRLLPVLVVAGVLVVAVVVALVVFSRQGGTGAPAGAVGAAGTTGPAATTAPEAAPADPGGGQPAAVAGGTTAVTAADGGRTEIETSSLQLCSGDGVALASGQQVATETIGRIDVTAVGVTEVSVTIRQTSGESVDGKVGFGCAVTGQSSIGPFNLDLSKVRSVEIGR